MRVKIWQFENISEVILFRQTLKFRELGYHSVILALIFIQYVILKTKINLKQKHFLSILIKNGQKLGYNQYLNLTFEMFKKFINTLFKSYFQMENNKWEKSTSFCSYLTTNSSWNMCCLNFLSFQKASCLSKVWRHDEAAVCYLAD